MYVSGHSIHKKHSFSNVFLTPLRKKYCKNCAYKKARFKTIVKIVNPGNPISFAMVKTVRFEKRISRSVAKTVRPATDDRAQDAKN